MCRGGALGNNVASGQHGGDGLVEHISCALLLVDQDCAAILGVLGGPDYARVDELHGGLIPLGIFDGIGGLEVWFGLCEVNGKWL